MMRIIADEIIISCSPATHVSLAYVVGVFVDVPGKAEVTDFHHVIVRKQNVPGCQVSVDTLCVEAQ